MKLWLEQFDSVEKISKEHLEGALKAGKFKMSEKQMEKFKKEFKKMKIQKFSKEKLFRMLLDYIKPNSEYDNLLVIKRLQLVIHIEVKSFSIDGALAPSETKRYHYYLLIPFDIQYNILGI